MANGLFSYDEIEKAKKQTFLKVYDDLFQKHSGIDHKTIALKDLKAKLIGRGTILKNDEVPNYERLLPKEEYIKEDNRFGPPHVDRLYLAIGDDNDIHECAQAECRVKKGNRFGFCHFQLDAKYNECKLVDLNIADTVPRSGSIFWRSISTNQIYTKIHRTTHITFISILGRFA